MTSKSVNKYQDITLGKTMVRLIRTKVSYAYRLGTLGIFLSSELILISETFTMLSDVQSDYTDSKDWCNFILTDKVRLLKTSKTNDTALKRYLNLEQVRSMKWCGTNHVASLCQQKHGLDWFFKLGSWTIIEFRGDGLDTKGSFQ